METTTDPKYANAKQFAEALGISRTRFEQLRSSGKTPAPDAEDMRGMSLWSETTVEAFRIERERFKATL